MTWCPLNAKNAIERAGVVIKFSDTIPEKLLSESANIAKKNHVRLRFDTPQLIGTQTLTLTANIPGPNEGNASTTADQSARRLIGLVMVEPDSSPVDITREQPVPIKFLEIKNDQISFFVGKYTSWEGFIKQFDEVVSPFLKCFQSALNVSVISLDYANRFSFLGDILDADPCLLFENLSPQIPEVALRENSLWHLHRGWFDKYKNHTVLININMGTHDKTVTIDVGDKQEKKKTREANVITHLEIRCEKGDQGKNLIHESLEFLHTSSKKILKDTLTKAIKSTIGFEKI